MGIRCLIILLISNSLFAQDKNYDAHVAAGGFFGIFGGSIGAAAFDHHKGALIGGVGSGAIAGIWREVKGAKTPGGKFDLPDLGFTLVGAVFTSSLVSLGWKHLTKGGKKKKQRDKWERYKRR